MTRAGRKLHWARSREQSWLLDLIAAHGGPRPRSCGDELPLPDVGANVLVNGRAANPPSDSRETSAARR